MAKPESWGSRIGVIMAVAGSAVGLGNFLRFPGQAAQNGGGAFMLPYFTALFLLGIPLCWAEWTMGRYGGVRGFNSAPGIYSVLWRRPIAKYFGGLALLVPLIIYMYYVVIESWCLAYAWHYVTGELMLGSDPAAYSAFFDRFVGKEADGALLGSSGRGLLATIAIVFAMNFLLIYRGVSSGIEQFCKYAMPLMAVLAVVVLVRVLSLGTPDPAHPERNVLNGLGFMWNPNYEALRSPKTWLAAAGQIFFSLSVGFGIVINYASYLKKNDDVVLSGLTASTMNEFFEVCLGGLITLPAAFVFLGASLGTMTTFGLGFQALPNVFAAMPGGRVFGALWFFMLFLAAITSSIAMLQPVIAFFEEGLGLKRRSSVALLAALTGIGCGFVVYFSKGMEALDTLDFWVGSFLIVCLAFFQAILFGWIFGVERGTEEAHRGAHMRIPKFVQWILKYVAPVYLGAMLIAFLLEDVPAYAAKIGGSPVAQLSIAVVAAIGLLLTVMIAVASKRWKAEGRLDRASRTTE
ncbi:MAG: sodium-dependent transporter [Planctomycetia bacterium]|nr:sodium-dependent transporter [Planctomycetia bacterium]